jgi:hypothetical protein
MKLSESTTLVITTILTSVAALFALIGLTTPKWITLGYGLWNCHDVCSLPTAALTIIALLSLVVSIILLVMFLINLFPRNLRFIPLGLLIIATLFLLIATTTYLRHFQRIGYSFELIITANAFAFFASVLLAFWFGTTINEKRVTNMPRTTIPAPTMVLPQSRVVL